MKIIELLIPDPRWFEAPRERTPQFSATYAKVSIALQQALRQLAPRYFFADVNRYRDTRAALSMLAYASSRPFRPKTRTDFTYDVTNSGMMATFFRMSRSKMIAGLAEAQARLFAAGQPDLAKAYDPREVRQFLKIVKKNRHFRKPLHRLLKAEGQLLNELTRFSALGDASPKERSREAALIARKWRAILAHLCLGADLSGLAPELLKAVTKAYLAAREPQPLEDSWPLEEDGAPDRDGPQNLPGPSADLLDWAA